MSYHSEHMNLKPLPTGVSRDGILKVKLLKQSAKNDKKMRKRHKDLYGNTKFTDEQILYFFIKHKGNYNTAAKDLGMSSGSYHMRLTRINSKLGTGKKTSKSKHGGGRNGVSEKEIKKVMKKHHYDAVMAAYELGISYRTLTQRCNNHGIPTQGWVWRKKKLTKKRRNRIIRLLKKNKGSISKTASDLLINPTSLTYIISKMYLIEVLGIGKYDK